MNHIEFIEKNVREELIRQGFTQSVAQGGGHFRLSIFTSACHRPVVREAFLMMLCATARLWAEKQTSAAEKREAKKSIRKGNNQVGLF